MSRSALNRNKKLQAACSCIDMAAAVCSRPQRRHAKANIYDEVDDAKVIDLLLCEKRADDQTNDDNEERLADVVSVLERLNAIRQTNVCVASAANDEHIDALPTAPVVTSRQRCRRNGLANIFDITSSHNYRRNALGHIFEVRLRERLERSPAAV